MSKGAAEEPASASTAGAKTNSSTTIANPPDLPTIDENSTAPVVRKRLAPKRGETQNDEEELTPEQLAEYQRRQKAARQRKVYRSALFKVGAFTLMVVVALGVKYVQEFFTTKWCATVYVDESAGSSRTSTTSVNTDLFVRVERVDNEEDGEALCLDETEFLVKNAKAYHGPAFLADKVVLDKIVQETANDVDAVVVSGIHLKECAAAAMRADLNAAEKAAACRTGNLAQAVVLCHGKRPTAEWAHQRISDIYRDHRINHWLHIDIDWRSDPDLVADVGRSKVELATQYKLVFARRCYPRKNTHPHTICHAKHASNPLFVMQKMDGDGCFFLDKCPLEAMVTPDYLGRPSGGKKPTAANTAVSKADSVSAAPIKFVPNARKWISYVTVKKAADVDGAEVVDHAELQPASIAAMMQPRKLSDAGELQPEIYTKPKLVIDNLLWLAWRFDFDPVAWVNKEFHRNKTAEVANGNGTPRFHLLRFNLETMEFGDWSEEWFSQKKTELNAATQDATDVAKVESIKEEWGWTLDSWAAAIVYI
ncbi:unnamed protein product [Amoebophrya sp. A120]|nr:unnamed protein product [Amoebophrya sp. A120]|eukprot:GSA120T00001477001.1